MKLTHIISALFTVGVFLLARRVHAEPEVARARFVSMVNVETLWTTACGLVPSVTMNGGVRPIDIRVSNRRCGQAPPGLDAIAVAVRIEEGEARHVIIEAEVPEGVEFETMQTVIVAVGNELRRRIALAMQPPPITVVQGSGWLTPSAQELPPRTILRALDARGRHRLHERHRSADANVAVIIGSILGGVALVVGVGVALSAALRNCSCSIIGGSF